MSNVNAGGILSAREVLTTLISSLNRSIITSDTCDEIVIKDMLIYTITLFNIITLAYKYYYTINKIVATVRCISNNQ